MTTDRDHHSLTAQELAELGLAVIDHIPDAVVFADRDGVIRFWNAGARRIFGFTADEAVGQSLDIIIPERLRARHWEGFHRMMASGHSSHPPEQLLSVPADTRSGRTISVEFTVAPLLDGGGRPKGIVALLRDVTERFEELKRLRKQARPA